MGDHVDLSFTVPTLSTDRQPLAGRHGAGDLAAVLCRRDQPTAPCTTFHAQPVTPGETVHAQDSLPPALLTGPATPVHYSVRILNTHGHASADAREAVAAGGAAPNPIESLAATTTARGVQLSWRAAGRSATSATILIEATSGQTHRSLTVPGDPGGSVDTSPRVGDTVTYTVTRSLPLPGTSSTVLNSEPARVTLTRAADTFPPAAPLGLVAVSAQMEGAAPEIDLSWEPNSESDLAGYLVERTSPGAGATAVLLTPVPITVLSYRDLTAQPGHTYRYAVRAQDTAGNRSKPGPPATESLHP